ncbi:subtilisin-like serine protease [Halovivax ruber XH-70]|uniref:Subtilisin-like serine protease n=1 Tax=Halovivax ruber (strain DSM 18193 / JCM 13892 / XH-70) TaxID=797302 RepID=L0IDF9_HALRX|nr:S8 family serine peptidase [Halovivax ruber]AGB17600.1 subtilisin-like serine protease [Halovivax ruber XH-70]
MTRNTDADDSTYRLDRRTVMQLASVAGLGAVFGTVSGTADASGPAPIDPDREPPWDDRAGASGRWVRDRWFVAFDADPRVRGGTASTQADERARFRADVRAEGLGVTERRDFTRLWNGLSVTAAFGDAVAMTALDSVAAVYPVAIVDRPDPADASPMLETALSMTGADAAQSELGFTGDGRSVAVIDTGIDYNHPDLGGSGDGSVVYTAESEGDRTLTGPAGDVHPRISHGWDYVGAGYDAGDPEADEPNPDPDPMDPQGHGTHVSGIVGADAADAADEDGVTGVAPDATLGAYKIFDTGSSTAEIIVAAMEDAYADGMDVINMSLGASLQWGQAYPTTAASNELVAQGVVVVNSAGNDGDLGAWSMSAPANAHDVISVASAENTHLTANGFAVDGLDDPVPYLELAGAELPPTEGESAPLALPAQSEIGGETGYFGCDAADFADFPEGHVALIQRGHCAFAQKYENAVAAGATGVVIFNNVSGLFSGTIQNAGAEGVWGAGISDTGGAALVDLLESGETVTLDFTDETVTVPNPNGGLLSSFSSYGQDVELAFGPSVTAPGGLITSTYPLEFGGYGMLSGTSMAAPHVAGSVALLLEAEPDLDPIDVRDRLQNVAEPQPWSLAPGIGALDHSFRQGAGMIQVDAAITADQRAAPGQLSLGDGAAAEVTVTLTNDGETDVTYELGHAGTVGTAVNTFSPGFYLSGSSVSGPETVTVPAGESAAVELTITAPAYGLPNHQYGGYVTFTPTDEAHDSLRVPYSGYEGDYQDLPLFGYYAAADDFVAQEPLLQESPDDPDAVAAVEAFFGHYPQELRLTAVNERTGQSFTVLEQEYAPRSPDPETYYEYVWDGRTRAGESDSRRPVPPGTYTLTVEALRALGDPENPEHWDTWESPTFRVSPPGKRAPATGEATSGLPADE